MAEQEQSGVAESDVQPIHYAFWDIPGWDAADPFRVIYSLQLFHEIDFVVNEGYRKIPHGGVETAGLLFGSVGRNELRIEAFRPIECEHASGPSLNFSERDLTELDSQIQNACKEKELEKFKVIGWFLGHTRAPLEMTENEAKQFDRFFPQPFRVSVMVKPERFQPTRFGFLVRRPHGEMPRNGLESAIILPLPGRSFKPGQLVPSIPAPNPITVPKRSSKTVAEQPREDVEADADLPPLKANLVPEASGKADAVEIGNKAPDLNGIFKPAAEKKPSELQLSDVWKIPPDEDTQEEAAPPALATAAQRDERRKLAKERARLIEEAFPPPVPLPVPIPKAGAAIPQPFRPTALPSLPVEATRLTHATVDRQTRGNFGDDAVPKSAFGIRSVTALAFAALLGCVVGYIGYLQLPAPVIPIDVRPLDQTMVVSWPPDETENAVYAAIRLNDGAPVPLSPQEKKTGHIAISAAKDFKVEIVSRNWIRDSRGIVRYLHSNNRNGRVVPMDAPKLP